MKQRVYYGWVIVAAFFAINVGIQATGTLNFGFFVLPMSAEMGISRSLFGWVQTARLLAGALSSILIGPLLDRHGPRLLLTLAAIGTGAGLAALSLIGEVWQFFLLLGAVGALGLSAPGGSVITSVPVAKWFVRQRGRAMAIATTGLGVGAIIFTPVTQVLIASIGWRNTWVVLAAISVAVAVPLSLIFMRRQPEDMGLAPDGDPPIGVNVRDAAPRMVEQAWTAGEALRTASFWKLTLAFVLVGFGMGGTSLHRIPYWVERGFDPQLVSYSFSADAAGAMVMALVAGLLAERFPSRLVTMGSCLGFALAMGLMLVGGNPIFLFGSTIIFGLAVGANMLMQTFIWAAYYGRAFLGTIRGVVLPATLVSSAVGAPLAGYIYDLAGSYAVAWWLFLGAYLVAALVMLSATPPVRRVST